MQAHKIIYRREVAFCSGTPKRFALCGRWSE